MEIDIEKLSEEELKTLRSKLRGTSKYKKKGIYRSKEISTRYFDPDEWEEFIYKVNPRLRFYYWFLMLTGMRYKEAKNVKKQNIDFKNRQLLITNPKGGKIMRYAQLSSYAIKLIRQYIEENRIGMEDNLNFPTIQHLIQTMKRECKNLKLTNWKDFSVHNLRKTHENYLTTLELPQNRITMHMGHNNKTAQEHYLSSSFIKDKKQLDKIRGWLGDIFG